MVLDETLMTRFDRLEIEHERATKAARAMGRQEGRQEGVLEILNLLAQGKTVEEARKMLGIE